MHTHSNDSTATGYTKEFITRSNTDESDPCSCNCLTTGDFICDTPPDPNIPNPNSSADYAFIDAMFGNCSMDNDNMVTDSCGDLYSDPEGIIANNVMSFLCDNQNSTPRLTSGQNLWIRKKMDNGDGTFMYQQDLSEPSFSQGFTVNAPMQLTTGEAFNGDIVVNSNLHIKNCTIELTPGHKIIVNAGANLTISNATVRTYSGSICYFTMGGKKNWEGIEINPSASNFTSVSVLAGSTIDTSEVGIYTTEGNFRFLNLAFHNSTLNGPAIDIANTFGVQKLKKSQFSNTVKVADSYFFGVDGCAFNFAPNSQESGLKIYNANLIVKTSIDGDRSTFTNCGRGVEFISSGSHFCEIEKVDFTNVLSGIHAESVAGFFDAHECTIKMRNPIGTTGFGRGIYLNNFMDLEIYNNNDIEGSGSGLQTGIDLDQMNENDNPNLIINNTIVNCNNGINSVEAKLGNDMSGVEFICNTMKDIVNDNFVTAEIGPHQGRGGIGFLPSKWRPAGNKFDGSPYCIATPDYCYSDFNYQGGGSQETDKKTYHYRNEDLENIEYYFDGSELPGLEIFKINRLINGELPQCTYPPVPPDPNPFPQVSTIRTQLLDGGHMDSIMILIPNDSEHDPTSIITAILNNSPWVSVPVVQTLFDYSQYYTEQEIADVIIQNPGVLDDNYIYAIALESSTFSTANQQAMSLAYQNGDERMDYEGSLVDLILDGTLHIKNTMHTEMDNGTFDQSVIRTALADKISYTKLYQIVESYLLEQDYLGALMALNAKQSIENIDPHLLLEKATYAEIIQMESDLNTQGEYWSKLSTANQNRLITIASTYNGVATVKARNILKMYFDMQFGALPTKPAYTPLQFTSVTRSRRNEDNLVKVYPNPAYNILNIELENNLNGCTFRLLSIDGRMVKILTLQEEKNKIDLSGIDNGIYFYEITQGGKMLSANKIIILD